MILLCIFIGVTFSRMLSTSDYLNRAIFPYIPPDRKFFYGSDSQQFGELYLPEDLKKPLPVVILLHGGCWFESFGLAPMSALAKNIATLTKVAVWNLEYRRIGNGGGWPMTFQDVAAGTEYVKEIAKTYQLDLSNVISIGHSAGGHLAAWLAARKNIRSNSILYSNNPLPIKAFISLAGIVDLDLANSMRVCGNAVSSLMGGSPTDFPERYLDGSPANLFPLSDVKQYYIQGLQDPLVPPNYINAFFEKIPLNQSLGKFITFSDGTGHFELVHVQSTAGRRVHNYTRDLINS